METGLGRERGRREAGQWCPGPEPPAPCLPAPSTHPLPVAFFHTSFPTINSESQSQAWRRWRGRAAGPRGELKARSPARACLRLPRQLPCRLLLASLGKLARQPLPLSGASGPPGPSGKHMARPHLPTVSGVMLCTLQTPSIPYFDGVAGGPSMLGPSPGAPTSVRARSPTRVWHAGGRDLAA